MRTWLMLATGALVCACSGPSVPDRRVSAPAPAPSDAADVSSVPSDAGQDEKLAAIGFAMKQLENAAHQCWAVVATERLDVEGVMTAQIAIHQDGHAGVGFLQNMSNSPKLADCVRKVIVAYRWPPPLYGELIQLPFEFTAPDAQNVIDRQLVSSKEQGKISVAVLMDEANTGNPEASMFELRIIAGSSTGLRRADRTELWYFAEAGELRGQTSRTPIAAGDFVFVPVGGARDVGATGHDLRAMVVVTPGAKEGAARGGALPTPEVSPTSKFWSPRLLPAAKGKTYPRGAGKVTIVAEPDTIYDKAVSASILELPAGAKVPEHVHDKETELLYVLAGSGTLTVAGVDLAVTPTSVVQIPPATKHSFTTTSDFRAVQVYTPGGPEQRFKR